MNKISDTELMDGARDYRLMTRQFVNALLELKNIIVLVKDYLDG